MSEDTDEHIEVVDPTPEASTSISQISGDGNDIELAANLLGLAQGEFIVLELAADDKDEAPEAGTVEAANKKELSQEQSRLPTILRRSATEKKNSSKVKLISMTRPGEELHRVIEVQLMEMEDEGSSTLQEIEVAARSFEDSNEKLSVAVRDVDPKMLTKDPDTNAYTCKTCRKSFTTKASLATHVLTHAEVRPYPCPQQECTKSFRTREACRRHFFSHSEEKKQFECEHCKKKFASNQGLKEHVTIHMNTKLYKCGECGKEFRQISSLSRHQTVHNGTKRYCCEICSKGFTQASYLRSHMKSHTGERPYRCDVCQKLYAHRSDLNRHKIIHSGERPYQCDWCGHSFADASSRRRHMRDHNEMRGTYTCHVCSQLFRRFGLLKTHLSRRHNIIEVAQGDANTLKIIGSDSMDLHEADVATPRAKLIQGQLFQVLCQLRKAKPNTQYQFVHPPRTTVSELLNATRQFRDSASGVTVEEQDLAVQLAMNALQAEQNESVLVCEQEIPLNNDGSISEHVYLTELPEGVTTNEDGNIIVNDEKGNISYFTLEQTDDDGGGDASKSAEQSEVQLDKDTIVEVEGTEAVDEEAMDVVEIDENVFQMHYDQQPELECDDYTRWLDTFVELCKCWSVPFEVELYEKVTHVHKTLLDALASPKGKLSEKENFEFLTNHCTTLGGMITQHLAAVLTNLK